jgi:hypothetical protein
MSERQQVPTLLVGLGGLGSEVVADVYRRLRRLGDVSEHVVFHVLDTDTNALNGLNGLGDSEETFTQLGGGSVHRVSDFRRAFPDTEAWFPFGRVVNSKDTRNGAGQIRAIARLTTLELFHRAGANGGLARAVARLRAIQTRGNKNVMPRVIIVCSLAGGTGAGSFIQIALHLRELIAGRTQDSADSVTVRGFFLLPDAMIMDGQGNIAASNHDPMRANALACIKELEAIRAFASGARSSAIELEFASGGARRPVEVNPYNAVYLFDLENMRGEGLTQKEHYVEMMSHALHLSLFSPMGDRQLSKEDNRIRDLLDADGKNIYGSAAVAEVRYPLDDLADYLARRWAADELSAVWLRPDQHVEELEAARERDVSQAMLAPPIDRAKEYIDFIAEEYAREGGLHHFKQIHQQRFILNPDGGLGSSKAEAWRGAVLEYLEGRTRERLGEAGSVPVVLLRQFETGQEAIEQFEAAIRRRGQLAADTVKLLPNSLAAQVMTRDADSVALAKGSEPHRMLYWLLDGMHPLAMRAFLYEARSLFEEALTHYRDEARDAKEALARYERAYDNLSTRDHVETLSERLQEVEQAGWPRRGRLWRKLAREYAPNAARQMRAIEQFAVTNIQELTLERMLRQIDRFTRLWEGLFFELRLRRDTLQTEIEELLERHDRNDNRTVRFVFASKAMKEELWRTFGAAGRQSESREAQLRGFEALYRAFAQTQVGPAQATSEMAGGFIGAMTASLRSKVMPVPGTHTQGILPRNILEAMEQEARLSGRNAKAVVQETLEDLWPRAVPFLQVTRGREGQKFSFWGISAALRERLEPMLGSALRARGEIAYDPSFDANEILYYNVHAGFLASELAKFVPGYQDVADTRPNGRYFDAYDLLRSQARERARMRDRDDQEPLGSHLDKRWAELLPEYWADVIAERVDRALIRGIATGALSVRGGQWVFSHNTLGEVLVPVAAYGAMHKLRGAIEQRFNVMVAIEQHFEEVVSEDQAAHRDDLEAQRFIRNFRSVSDALWDDVTQAARGVNLLALLTQLAVGTNSYDRIAEMRMERVFRTACQELHRYVGLMTGSPEAARGATLKVLASLDETVALRERGDDPTERQLLLDRLAAAKGLRLLEA